MNLGLASASALAVTVKPTLIELVPTPTMRAARYVVRILAKRLEAGSFQLPPLPPDATQVQIDGATFASLLAGIDFTAARRGWFRRLPVA